MTVNGWLASRTQEPPPALAARIDEAVGGRAERSVANTALMLVDSADAMLRELLNRESEGRDSALDLLTVDALATYAFEAASADPATLTERAEDAMRRFAAAARA
ncbi:MAG: hypothetical protein ABI442_13495 [Gemmatimonadaceae bacterium]